MTPNLHLWLIPLLPLIGAAINGFFGRRFSRPVITAVALVFSGAAFVMALGIVSQFASLTLPYHPGPVATWIRSGAFQVDFSPRLACC